MFNSPNRVKDQSQGLWTASFALRYRDTKRSKGNSTVKMSTDVLRARNTEMGAQVPVTVTFDQVANGKFCFRIFPLLRPLGIALHRIYSNQTSRINCRLVIERFRKAGAIEAFKNDIGYDKHQV